MYHFQNLHIVKFEIIAKSASLELFPTQRSYKVLINPYASHPSVLFFVSVTEFRKTLLVFGTQCADEHINRKFLFRYSLGEFWPFFELKILAINTEYSNEQLVSETPLPFCLSAFLILE